jgi:hypothetical protein
MAIISGTFFTPDYPEFLRVIAEVPPLTHYAAHPRRDGPRPTRLVGQRRDRRGGRLGPDRLAAAIRGFRWQPVEA